MGIAQKLIFVQKDKQAKCETAQSRKHHDTNNNIFIRKSAQGKTSWQILKLCQAKGNILAKVREDKSCAKISIWAIMDICIKRNKHSAQSDNSAQIDKSAQNSKTLEAKDDICAILYNSRNICAKWELRKSWYLSKRTSKLSAKPRKAENITTPTRIFSSGSLRKAKHLDKY